MSVGEPLARTVSNKVEAVDLYFGLKPPVGQALNWLSTTADMKWFPWFRFYGPEKAILDKTWTMGDVELVK